MAHQWAPWYDPAKTPAEHFMSSPQRRCAHCGIVQTHGTDTAWGRIVRRYWYPLAGRCKPACESGSGNDNAKGLLNGSL